jgi:hypothetical protein
VLTTHFWDQHRYDLLLREAVEGDAVRLGAKGEQQERCEALEQHGGVPHGVHRSNEVICLDKSISISKIHACHTV